MATQNEVGGAPRQAFFTSLTQTCTDVTVAGDNDKEGIGTVRTDQYGNKYRWVRLLSTAMAARAGAPACYDASLGVSATADTTFLQGVRCDPGAASAPAGGDVNFFAGIFMAAIPAYASSKYSYGWIMTSGVYTTAKMASAETGASSYAAAYGDILVPTTLTTTTGTNSSRAFAFIHNSALAVNVVGTSAGTAVTVEELTQPYARVIAPASTVAGSATTTSPVIVVVKGFIP